MADLCGRASEARYLCNCVNCNVCRIVGHPQRTVHQQAVSPILFVAIVISGIPLFIELARVFLKHNFSVDLFIALSILTAEAIHRRQPLAKTQSNEPDSVVRSDVFHGSRVLRVLLELTDYIRDLG